ncbi:MAG: hypothetical protein ACK5RE_16025, partial [Pseudanabaena sp.]
KKNKICLPFSKNHNMLRGGPTPRLTLFGFYVLTRMTTAIKAKPIRVLKEQYAILFFGIRLKKVD